MLVVVVTPFGSGRRLELQANSSGRKVSKTMNGLQKASQLATRSLREASAISISQPPFFCSVVYLVVGGDMQFALALDTNSGPHQIRSCEGDGIDRLEKLSIGGRKQEKALRNRCFGGRVAATTQCILTSDACPETLHSQTQSSRKNYADANRVSAIILGGGTGSQLFPLTSTRATPAVPVGGCYRLIDIPMSNCFNSGINKIFVMSQFNSTSLNRHIHRTYLEGGINFADGSVQVLAATQMPEEPAGWFQGTADSIRKFIWVLEDYYSHKSIDNIVILSGDQLYRMNYMELVQKHVEDDADITISCAPVDESRASKNGLVKIDHTGRVLQFFEKPKGADLNSMRVETNFLSYAIDDAQKYPYLASMGIYVFKKDALLDLLKSKYIQLHDFGSEILPRAVLDHSVQACIFTGYWEDVGTIKSFFDANLALTEQPSKFDFYDPKTPFFTAPRCLPPTQLDKCKMKDAFISDGCLLRECNIEHSVIGVCSRVSSGCELKDSVMMGADTYETEEEASKLLLAGKVPVGIGRNTKIRNCIIDMNARIGKNVVITNSKGIQEADHPEEGYYIRSGIVVILKNATINDGSVI
ncbi:glucose-1-phosphate adenylyltransferase large subunit 1, chloroplastic/amyloplastic isoform X2 [Zea mays]|uniref:glucose-1-phosphate adenylyltransferase large subunit 1, chloroplastic/amyloplastic isoform X2 n=1 Tax=Zea mays TaxID=4577 RepID=UPI0009AA4B90|nr:glucose-1-phosphate adenylyltransferase large subunit 1, chloroplastic/amyloplastic isoform X2 [Zea mays]|eukprot:XP_020405659.1 glucose-1-phosphate adenylyltransferase large subunit 1, chloroplastic/amyloplastic isoform X2 [Zea mays]